MNARTGRFWGFQAIFWSIAGAALFVSGATQMPFTEAFVRNLFLLVVGFLSSFFLAMLIDQLRFMPILKLRLTSYGLAYAIAAFCVVTINAITFTLRGLPLDALQFGQWFSGALNLGLIYAFWSELFIQQIYLDDMPVAETSAPLEKLIVEHAGKMISLPLADVHSISAAGDYVEIHAGGKSYLDRNTLSAVEERLGAGEFVRVHRSRLVNATRVQSVTPLGKGRYRLHLDDDSSIETSRGYRDAVRLAFLTGAADAGG